MVFTDGNANGDGSLQKASKAWFDHNVAVFAVGIGNQISEYGKLFALGASMYSMYSSCTTRKPPLIS